MSENSSIEWTDHTFNPWIGCTKVSPGCAHCYAETLMDTRYGRMKWGKGQERQRTSEANWKLPLRWNLKGSKTHWGEQTCKMVHTGHRCNDLPKVFCGSLCDWLDDEVPIEWLADLLKLIHDTPNLDWLLLTKRPELFWKRMALGAGHQMESAIHPNFDTWLSDWIEECPPANVWIGTSVEDQQRADERIPELIKIPAKVRFLSVEPMLGPIDLQYAAFNGADSLKSIEGISWCIFGGESGKGARPCNVEWIRDGVRQCRAAGVAPFVKQLGSRPTKDMSHEFFASDLTRMNQAIAKAGGVQVAEEQWQRHIYSVPMELKDRKGGDPSEWPEDLRVREFPTDNTTPEPAIDRHEGL